MTTIMPITGRVIVARLPGHVDSQRRAQAGLRTAGNSPAVRWRSVRKPLLAAAFVGLTGCQSLLRSPDASNMIPAAHAAQFDSTIAAVDSETVVSSHKTAKRHSPQNRELSAPTPRAETKRPDAPNRHASDSNVTAVSYLEWDSSAGVPAGNESSANSKAEVAVNDIDANSSIDQLVAYALATNPRLEKLAGEVEVAWAKVPQMRGLPDPMFQTRAFSQPMDEAAELMVSQEIPWPGRLGLTGQQAALEAQAMEQMLAAERLVVASQAKSRIIELYVLEEELRVSRENQKFLEPLAKVVLARVEAGATNTRPGDVLRATLELSRLAEEQVSLGQRITSTRSRLNELLNRPANAPLPPAKLPSVRLGNWTAHDLRDLADRRQPELVSAALRTDAARLGLRVAHLARVPSFTVSFGHTFMHDGNGAWTGGGGVNVPLVWRRKYDALEAEAAGKHVAAIAEYQEVNRKYDALLADLFAQARAADETTRIYKDRIIPQARQTLESDLATFELGDVEFDRVINDFRDLLTVQIQYQRVIGQFATAIVTIEQAVGAPLSEIDTAKDMPPGESHHGAGNSR